MLPPLLDALPVPDLLEGPGLSGGTCRTSGVGWLNHASIPESVGLSMRQFRNRLTRACVYFGVCWPNHASILGSVALSMRLFQDRLASIPGSMHASISEPVPGMVYFGVGWLNHASTRGRSARACVYSGAGSACAGIGRPEHASISGSAGLSMRLCVDPNASIPEPVGHASIPGPVDGRSIPGSVGLSMRLSEPVDPGMRLSRGRLAQACVYPGIGRPEHASIPEPVDPSMRLSRGRLAQACVYPGIGRPEHASIPEPVDPSMRLFRGRLAQACVYRDRSAEHASIPEQHASIPGSVGLSMRLSRSRLTRACVYPGVGWPKHASIPGSVGLSMRLSRDRSA